jgi:Arc/MetJ family transcription regulator
MQLGKPGAAIALETIHINMRCLHIERLIRMRTNIEIDDQLMHQAMNSSGAHTKRAVVEAGLRLIVKTHSQGAMRKLRGKVRWEGDLNKSRLGRVQE